MRRRAVWALLFLALPGCRELATCPADLPVRSGGRCVARVAGDGGPSDAGPCGGACGGTTPVCGPGGTCGPCTSGADCPAAAPVCHTTGACVECSMASTDACASSICLLGTHTCATGGTVAACRACTADADCSPGMLCVPMTFGAADAGNHCLWRRDAYGLSTAPGGLGCSSQPYRMGLSATSVDGIDAMVCAPSTTTCDALLSLLDRRTCRADTDCGRPSIDDGLCGPSAGCSMSCTCTIPCTVSLDCPSGGVCDATARRCR